MAAHNALVKVSKTDAGDDFKWSDKKRRCMELLLRGWTKTAIAKELGKHPNTITAWTNHPTFLKKLQDAMLEFSTATRLRRMRMTTMVNDRIANLGIDAIKAAEKAPHSLRKQTLARNWLSEFRSLRNEERLNFGESTDNRNVNTNMNHTGHITAGSRTFKEWMKEHADKGVIDASLVGNAKDGQEAVIEAVTHILVEGEYLAEVDKEGREKQQGE